MTRREVEVVPPTVEAVVAVIVVATLETTVLATTAAQPTVAANAQMTVEKTVAAESHVWGNAETQSSLKDPILCDAFGFLGAFGNSLGDGDVSLAQGVTSSTTASTTCEVTNLPREFSTSFGPFAERGIFEGEKMGPARPLSEEAVLAS
eukprot:CAMPEP_0194533570 /NCGR_PEP_ID=MMETSP0253-20130528/71472_1 /TAXON_ID=2966 /ORGANISM="Noctiluca scintillans" /LENGTH=148 /DNA_ID=CAMNT_0039379133 /DNA_START=1198 /DNA_END=1640 /DNA_ORIENTATION=+